MQNLCPTILGCQMVLASSFFTFQSLLKRIFFTSTHVNVFFPGILPPFFPVLTDETAITQHGSRWFSPGTFPSIAFSKDPIFDHHKVQVREVVQHASRCWELGVDAKNMKLIYLFMGVLYGKWLKILQKGCTCSLLKNPFFKKSTCQL